MLAVVTHGSKIIFPGETFDPKAVLHAISDEKCTALHGVPTMFEAILSVPKPEKFDCSNLRTGIIAGAPVPRPLMKRLFGELNMTEYTSSYGSFFWMILLAQFLTDDCRPHRSITNLLQRSHHRHH